MPEARLAVAEARLAVAGAAPPPPEGDVGDVRCVLCTARLCRPIPPWIGTRPWAACGTCADARPVAVAFALQRVLGGGPIVQPRSLSGSWARPADCVEWAQVVEMLAVAEA